MWSTMRAKNSSTSHRARPQSAPGRRGGRPLYKTSVAKIPRGVGHPVRGHQLPIAKCNFICLHLCYEKVGATLDIRVKCIACTLGNRIFVGCQPRFHLRAATTNCSLISDRYGVNSWASVTT
jgi:hypothetical protein